MTTVASELEMGKSAVHNHRSMLEKYGYVVKDPDTKTYRFSLKFHDIGGQIRSEIDVSVA